jgi:hypothetical protein
MAWAGLSVLEHHPQLRLNSSEGIYRSKYGLMGSSPQWAIFEPLVHGLKQWVFPVTVGLHLGAFPLDGATRAAAAFAELVRFGVG